MGKQPFVELSYESELWFPLSLKTKIGKYRFRCYHIRNIISPRLEGRLPLFRNLISKLKLIRHENIWGATSWCGLQAGELLPAV